MIRALGAAVLAAHGLLHLIGFVVPWRIAVVDGFADRTTALGGVLALGDGGARILVCVLGLPETGAGIVVNLGILAALAWAAFGRGRTAAAVARA